MCQGGKKTAKRKKREKTRREDSAAVLAETEMRIPSAFHHCCTSAPLRVYCVPGRVGASPSDQQRNQPRPSTAPWWCFPPVSHFDGGRYVWVFFSPTFGYSVNISILYCKHVRTNSPRTTAEPSRAELLHSCGCVNGMSCQLRSHGYIAATSRRRPCPILLVCSEMGLSASSAGGSPRPSPMVALTHHILPKTPSSKSLPWFLCFITGIVALIAVAGTRQLPSVGIPGCRSPGECLGAKDDGTDIRLV